MENKANVNSVLKLDRIVFDEIEFKRFGFASENELEYEFEVNIAQKQDEEVYRVTLVFKGKKEDEYSLDISLTGFFLYDDKNNEFNEKQKNTMIEKSTLAILMPYMRSQISLMTAQPEVECVVLPPFNINKMVDEYSK